VYIDSLVDVIDGIVETGNSSEKEYGEKITEWLKKEAFE